MTRDPKVEIAGLIDQRDRAEETKSGLQRRVDVLERRIRILEDLLIMQGAVNVG